MDLDHETPFPTFSIRSAFEIMFNNLCWILSYEHVPHIFAHCWNLDKLLPHFLCMFVDDCFTYVLAGSTSLTYQMRLKWQVHSLVKIISKSKKLGGSSHQDETRRRFPIQTSCGRMPSRSRMNEKIIHSSEVRHIKTSWGWLPYIAIIPVTSEMVYDGFDGTAQPPVRKFPLSLLARWTLELPLQLSFIMWRHMGKWPQFLLFLWHWDSQDLKHVLASCCYSPCQPGPQAMSKIYLGGLDTQFRTRLSRADWIGEEIRLEHPNASESCESGSYMKRSSVNSWNSFYLLGGTTNLYLDITWYNYVQMNWDVFNS